MNNKSLLIALGASLSIGLVNVANANSPNVFEAEKLSSGYSNGDGKTKLTEGKCGDGKCGNGKCGNGDDDKQGQGKCGS